MPRYEFKDRNSSKFWEINLKAKSFTVRFGKIGAEGQTQEKSFATASVAKEQYRKLIDEKLKKGYFETNSGAPSSKRLVRTTPRKKTSAEASLAAFVDKVGIDPAHTPFENLLEAAERGKGYKSVPATLRGMVTVAGSQFSPLLRYAIDLPARFEVCGEVEANSATMSVFIPHKKGGEDQIFWLTSARGGKSQSLRKIVCQEWKLDSLPELTCEPFDSAQKTAGVAAPRASIYARLGEPLPALRVKRVVVGSVEFYQGSWTKKFRLGLKTRYCQLIGVDEGRILKLTITDGGAGDNFESGMKIAQSFRKMGAQR